MAKRIRKNWLLITVLITTVIFTVGASMWLIINESNFEINAPITKLNPHIQPLTADSLFEGESLSRANFCIARPSSSNTSKELTGEYFYRLSDQEEWQSFTTISAKFGSAHTAELKPITYQIKFKPTGIYAYLYNEATSTNILNVKAVAYVGSNYYGNIPDAVTAANTAAASGTSTNVVVIPDLGVPLNVSQSITLNSKVSMYVPFETTITNNNHTGTGTYDTNSDSGIKSLPKTAYADKDETAINNYRKTLINLTSGADLSIAAGANLYLGGEFAQQGITGKYCEINLGSSSKIEVGGNFYCYGYVKENANTFKNGNQSNNKSIYSNDYDSGRLIEVLSSGYLKTALAVYDMKSGGNLLSLNDNGIFPLNVFDFPNMQTYVEINAGASLISQTHIYATISGSDQIINQEIPIVRPDSSTSAMFYLTSGTAAFEYCPNSVTSTSTTALTRIFINGTVEQGEMGLKVSIYDIVTGDKFVPISYKLNIFINDGGTYTTDYKIKFLPATLLKINSGGQFNVNSEVIVYDAESSTKVQGYGTRAAATFINNGTITLTQNAKIGAFIQTEMEDDSAIVNFNDCATATAFSVSSPEGLTVVDINITSSGYFEDQSDEGKSIYQFKEGSIINSSLTGLQCWAGEKFGLYKLNVSIAETNYSIKVFSYQVFIADDTAGNNQVESTSGVSSSAGEYEITDGKYVKIAASRYASAVFADGTALDPNSWYLVTGDMNLIITPNEGVSITVSTEGISGAGYTNYTIKECATQNGTYVEVGAFTANGTVNIIKNYYFTVTKGGTGAGLFGNGSITEGPVSSSSVNGKKFQATANYKIHFAGSSCFVEGTLVTLADGTQKKVEDLTLNDEVLIFNHNTGKLEKGKLAVIDHANEEARFTEIINLKFSNGEILRISFSHGLFDADLNKYVFITADNYKDYLGHKFYSVDYKNKEFVSECITLTDAFVTYETVRVFTPISVGHMNCFASGILTAPPDPQNVNASVNIFELDENMKYDLVKMQADIAKYGLYTYEDFKDYVTEEEFETLSLAYLKVAVGKGMVTWEQIIEMLPYVKRFS